MDQLQMVIEALRNSGANGGMVGQAAQALQGRPGQIEQAAGQQMPPQGMPPQGAPAPQMQNASAAPNAQGLTPFQQYQLQQAQQGMGGQ